MLILVRFHVVGFDEGCSVAIIVTKRQLGSVNVVMLSLRLSIGPRSVEKVVVLNGEGNVMDGEWG